MGGGREGGRGGREGQPQGASDQRNREGAWSGPDAGCSRPCPCAQGHAFTAVGQEGGRGADAMATAPVPAAHHGVTQVVENQFGILVHLHEPALPAPSGASIVGQGVWVGGLEGEAQCAQEHGRQGAGRWLCPWVGVPPGGSPAPPPSLSHQSSLTWSMRSTTAAAAQAAPPRGSAFCT